MMPFDTLYPEVAKRESRAFIVGDRPDLPSDSYVLREFYCTERGCDCRRALLQIHSVARKKVVATINYAFQPPTGRFADEGQMFLDPINPQSELSDALFEMFEGMIESDREYHDRLVRHYEMWKRVVDDVSHPDHEKVRSDVSFGPAFPRREPERREGPKVGVNDPCPCGSGKKFKKCCRR